MARYECPECDGGFPAAEDGGCPWCGEQLNTGSEPDIGSTIFEPQRRRFDPDELVTGVDGPQPIPPEDWRQIEVDLR